MTRLNLDHNLDQALTLSNQAEVGKDQDGGGIEKVVCEVYRVLRKNFKQMCMKVR